jgi:hypothetical protein
VENREFGLGLQRDFQGMSESNFARLGEICWVKN